LVLGTENVSIILLKFSTSRQTAQGTGGLVTVQNTKVCNSHGQLAVTTLTVTEQDEMSRAVHGLKTPLTLLNIQLEHILTVVFPMAGGLPKTNIVHVGGLDFLVTTLAVLGAEKSLESVENLGSGGKQERATRGNIIEEEQLLLLTNAQVVALRSLLEELQMLGHQVLVGESDTTDTLQGVVGLVAEEISAT
jgi:hypothetical protein